MLTNDYTTNLLDMEHMEIISSEKSSSEIVIRVQMKRRGEYCPKCGGYTEAVHDYREQTVNSSIFYKAFRGYYGVSPRGRR